MLDRRRDAGEVANRANARVKVVDLPERDVDGADAAADGRRQRALDGHLELADDLVGLLRQPRVGAVDLVGLVAAYTSIQATRRLPP